MATVTKQKERPTSASPKSTADVLVAERQRERRDNFERFRQQAADRYAAEAAVLDDILDANESLAANTLILTTSQRLVAEEITARDYDGRRSIHDIVKLLRKRSLEIRLREEVGDPAVLCLAEADLAEALRRERETVAAIEDIDVSDSGDEAPALSKQIGALQRKLAGLKATREKAAAVVASIRSRRERLRDMAPGWLKTEVAREVAARRPSSPCWAEFKRCKDLMKRHTQFVWYMDPEFNDRSRSDLTVRNYCREFIPAALRKGSDGGTPREYADIDQVRRFIANELPGILADLQARRLAAAAEWKRIQAEAERPLEDFVREGIV